MADKLEIDALEARGWVNFDHPTSRFGVWASPNGNTYAQELGNGNWVVWNEDGNEKTVSASTLVQWLVDNFPLV